MTKKICFFSDCTLSKQRESKLAHIRLTLRVQFKMYTNIRYTFKPIQTARWNNLRRVWSQRLIWHDDSKGNVSVEKIEKVKMKRKIKKKTKKIGSKTITQWNWSWIIFTLKNNWLEQEKKIFLAKLIWVWTFTSNMNSFSKNKIC